MPTFSFPRQVSRYGGSPGFSASRARKRSHSGVVQRSVLVCGGLFYYGLLLYIYHFYITPTHSYYGLRERPLPDWTWFLSVVFALAPLLWLPIHFKRPSDYACWMLYLLAVYPTALISFLVSSSDPIDVVPAPLLMLISFALFDFLRRRPPIKLPAARGLEGLFTYILPLVIVFLVAALLYLTETSLNLSFEVYERRLEARQYGGTLIGYTGRFLMNVCIPLSVAIAIMRRQWHFFVLVVISVLALFSYNGTKGSIGLPFLMIAMGLLARKARGHGFIILAGAVILSILAIIGERYFQSHIVTVFLVRRIFMVPGMITTWYFEFFSQNANVLMTDSIGRYIFEPRYDLPTTMLIGYNYLNNVEASANVNIWAGGYAHFGLPGLAMVSYLASLTFRALDGMAGKGKFVITACVCSSIAMTWSSQTLHTSLLSSGVATIILALYLYPDSRSAPQSEPAASVPATRAAIEVMV